MSIWDQQATQDANLCELRELGHGEFNLALAWRPWGAGRCLASCLSRGAGAGHSLTCYRSDSAGSRYCCGNRLATDDLCHYLLSALTWRKNNETQLETGRLLWCTQSESLFHLRFSLIIQKSAHLLYSWSSNKGFRMTLPCWSTSGVRRIVFPTAPDCWIGVRIIVIPGRIWPPPPRTWGVFIRLNIFNIAPTFLHIVPDTNWQRFKRAFHS